VARPIIIGSDALLQLWIRFVDFQSHQLEPSTMTRDYAKITKRLCTMPDLSTPAAVRDWLLSHYAADTTRRTLERFSACCEWAIASGYIATNPYAPLRKQFRKRSRGLREGFLASERDAILDAIASDRYSSRYTRHRQSFYLPYIQFLFWTGCRLEEASALRWDHISKDYTTITFSEALPADTRILGDIKTHKHRGFPCNARLMRLLQSRPRSEGYVFPSQGGADIAISSQNLLNRTWKPVVEALAEAGILRKYLPTKHTRHTFITLALEAGMDPKDIALLVGNTPEVIYKHYAAPKPTIVIPEF
jgi:integrase